MSIVRGREICYHVGITERSGDAMKEVLFVDACVRPQSRTRALARLALERLDGHVTELNLEREGLRPLTLESLETREAALKRGELDHPSLRYARQFAAADEIVIAAPYWDLSFPASLKAYIENVDAIGLVFHYLPDGRPEGLCRAKRLIYITTAGGPIFADMGYEYIRTLAEGFYQIPALLRFSAENLDTVGSDPDAILARTEREILSALT